ncbi:hypothetical protein [Lysinibacillus sp. 38-6]|uniref:hypothetical protein n=1 Tax=Lysinibacillus sp. 38-6 TaxID=3385991 RepID=UPI003908A427
MKRKKHKVELKEAKDSKMNKDRVIRCEEMVYTIQRKLFDLNFFVKRSINHNEQIEIISSINSSLKELRINLSDVDKIGNINSVNCINRK